MRPTSQLDECLKRLRETLSERILIATELLAVMIGHPAGSARLETTPIPKEVLAVIPLLIQAMGSSSSTILRLSDPPGLQTRDCFAISRSVVELAVNICYIMAKGPEAADRAIRHARQKSVRDLTRESTVCGQTISLAFSGQLDFSRMPGIEKELQEFVSRKGREKSWVDENIDQRIETAGQLNERVLSALHFARLMIYRHSSEVLHGSLFGTHYLFGLTTPAGAPESSSELAIHLGEQTMMILMAVGLAHQAVADAFHVCYGFRSAKHRSDELTRSLGELRMFQNHQATR